MGLRDEEYLIFGYGSLIWKPPIHAVEATPGFIKGYVRRFWQASEDHRGTPEQPGRVVTLVPYVEWREFVDDHHTPEDEVCWGMVYRMDPLYTDKVKDYLDFREKNGYSVDSVDVYEHLGDAEPKFRGVTVYIGTSTNPQFVGPQSTEELAGVISKTIGPSGPNKEYLYQLAESLRQLSPESKDVHVWELEAACKALEGNERVL